MRTTREHPAVESGRASAYVFACLASRDRMVTSEDIASATGINSTQVRRDISSLIGVQARGRRGVGYPAHVLARQLRDRIDGPGGSGGAILIAAVHAGVPLPGGVLPARADEISKLAQQGAELAARIDALLVEAEEA